MSERFTREQRTIVVYTVLSLVLILVVIQLWLLTATMNAFLGGDNTVVIPALIASMVCWLVCAGLVRTLRTIERP